MLIYLHKLNIEIQRGRFLLPMTNYILIQCAQKEDFKVITCFGILKEEKKEQKRVAGPEMINYYSFSPP